MKKYVKSSISRRIEDKYILQDGAVLNPIPFTGATTLLSHSPAISQGTGIANRIGDKIKLKDLNLRMHFATPSTYNSFVRVLIVQYKEQDGRDLVAADVMNTSAGYGPIRPLHPPQVLHEKVRVLFDKVYQVESTGNVTADENHKVVVIKKRLGYVQSYLRNAAAGTYADIATNGTYLLLFGSQDAAATNRCILRDIQWSLTYEDA